MALLSALYWSWPPVSLTLVVPASEVAYWSDIVQDFEATHRTIRIRPIGLDNPHCPVRDRAIHLRIQAGGCPNAVTEVAPWTSKTDLSAP
ncbi:MAG: hypothetical protein ACFB4J_06250 [Elainellaceae cyanobacterium]